MNGIALLTIAVLAFIGGYFIYSRYLGKILGIDAKKATPAVVKRDGVDYVPAHPVVLFGHHFAAIAGAGPIVGPVLAAEFGWASVALWIILGCIFIGAAHDMITLFLSVRHEGRSIGSVIGTILGKPGKLLFLLFSWSALILVVAAFSSMIAGTFVADPGIATASLLFIAEAILFGLCVYRFKISVLVASLIFVPLMFAFVWIGNLIPLDLQALLGLSAAQTKTVWIIVLLVYCFFASTCPVWILLQPRDYLNAYLLYAMMALGFIGVFVASPVLQLSAFSGFSVEKIVGGKTIVDNLFPFLFVTVACGACSGFHALVASGTSAKQLDSEKNIRPIAYGGMLLEGVLAIIALVGVAGTFASQEEYAMALSKMEAVQIFAAAIAGFSAKIGIPLKVAESFMLLSVSAFLMTTVDAGTRLARFSWQELIGGAKGAAAGVARNMYVGTALVCALAGALLLGSPSATANLWTIFASANQLLASLTLLSATLWFIRTGRKRWSTITAVPMAFMLCISGWALGAIWTKAFANGSWLILFASSFLMVLAIVLIALAIGKVSDNGREEKI